MAEPVRRYGKCPWCHSALRADGTCRGCAPDPPAGFDGRYPTEFEEPEEAPDSVALVLAVILTILAAAVGVLILMARRAG